MPRTAKIYLPLDVDFFEGQRVEQVGEKAAYLYLAMCCKAKGSMTDGLLTDRQVAGLLIPGTPARLKALVAAGMIARADDGRWLILGFTERNLTAAQIAEKRERERIRKGKPADSARNDGGNGADSDRNLKEVRGRGKALEVEASQSTTEDTEGPGRAAFVALQRAGLPPSQRLASKASA